ncbi:MAG TPA: glycoside hydrolase family 16 protein [Hymenobacter sp.]|uniref:glycoside hydrolase family 16 protein n=1 Tax=Hymenobacter sp. TaxID=1898978 RepID=UPI002D7FF366|nr:glycoside hydrolase family 16 protein [Hymenobacter sp.]HET9502907.1 glycoside hydrolase family 16 protein [Hymenobacter sp.]
MTFLLNPTLLRNLSAGLVLLLSTGGCTQEPPGPTISDDAKASNATTNATPKAFADYTELVWSDEFDTSALDQNKWVYEVKDVWFNNELQATTNRRDNVTVTGGNLNIIAKPESYNGRNYTSGRIITKGKKDFLFGRLDVRAKLPKGKGIWPAIWMLGSNDSQVSWPACGEIDIMELRGSTPRVNNSTMHYGSSVATHQYKGTQYTLPSSTPGDFSTDFHTFSCVRGQDKLEFFVDGVSYYTFTPSLVTPYAYPFNNPFYVILNVAVGGDFDGNPDATTVFPQTMQVDYVRFYQYK